MNELITKKAEKFIDNTLQELQVLPQIIITDNNGYLEADERLRRIKVKEKELLDIRLTLTRPVDGWKAQIMDYFRPVQEALAKRKSMYDSAMTRWRQEQEKRDREEEKHLQEIARKEEEKKRLALQKRAKKAEEKGNIERAEELQEQAEEVYVSIPIVSSTIPKVKGTYVVKTWKYRIIDISKVDRKWLVPNDKMLSDFARATKGYETIKGIEFYCVESIGSRT